MSEGWPARWEIKEMGMEEAEKARDTAMSQVTLSVMTW